MCSVQLDIRGPEVFVIAGGAAERDVPAVSSLLRWTAGLSVAVWDAFPFQGNCMEKKILNA